MTLPTDPRQLSKLDPVDVMAESMREARAEGRAKVYLFATRKRERRADGNEVALAVRRAWNRRTATGTGCG